MSTKGNLTRGQAIAIVGTQAVNAVESANCDSTNRLIDWGNDRVEFAASVPTVDQNGMRCTLLCYYYPTQQQLDDAGDDLGNVDWVIYGYDVV